MAAHPASSHTPAPRPLRALPALCLALAGCGADPVAPAARDGTAPPRHPFMAGNGVSNIHNDAWMSDAYTWRGPETDALAVTTGLIGGECATLTFDRAGRILSICISANGARRLVALDPVTLAELASYVDLPGGSLSGTSFGAGGYFYLDHQDRVVVATLDSRLLRLRLEGSPLAFVVEDEWALDGAGGLTADDGVVESALPDWGGRLWFVTERGTVGFLDPGSGAMALLRQPGEEIGNSFAVDETGGVFVVTDHALYRYDAVDGGVAVTWREAYDRGTALKAGQVNFGSGTTPTLLAGGYIAITDNAEPRMNVLVYHRGAEHAGARRVCQVPVFADGASATDNSLIGWGRSLVVENNAGYSGLGAVTGANVTAPGLTRIDLDEDGAGCREVWTSAEAAPSVVPKLSVPSGLVYTYVKRADGWYFTALEFETGVTRYAVLVGAEFGYNNHWSPVSLAPDGAAYVGNVNGLVALHPR